MAAELHLAVHTFALQLLFQNAKSLVDVVVADDDLHENLTFVTAPMINEAMPISPTGMCQVHD
jgi:hypothetical protein